jgi:DNA-binding transcriptional MerR regulator
MTETHIDTTLGFRSPQVCAVVGITYRQLDYWDRSGLLGPSLQEATGSGTQRLYTFADIVTLRVVKRLKDAGTSLHKIRSAFEQLEWFHHLRGQKS